MGAEQKTMRVMIVEDHAAFREALAVVPDAQPGLEAAAQAGSLAEARRLLRSGALSPDDAAVVDLGLPDGDGANLAEELAEEGFCSPVLALADQHDLEHCGPTLGAGAAEVLSKCADLRRILDAIRRLGARRQ